jgi:hypothetical protein
METQQVFQVDAWRGLNLASPDNIDDAELTVCRNFIVNEVGELYPRPGLQYRQIVPDVHIQPLPPALPDGTYNITWLPPHNPYDPSLYALPTSRADGAPSTFIHCLINGKLYYSITSPPNFLRAYQYEGSEIQVDDFYLSSNALYCKGTAGVHANKLFRVFDAQNVEIAQEDLTNVSDHLVKPWAVYHKGRHFALEQSTDFPDPSVSGVWDKGQWDVDVWGTIDSFSPLRPWPSRNVRFSVPVIFDDYSTYFQEDTDSPLLIPDDLGYPLQLVPYRNLMLILTTRSVLVLYADGTPDQWTLNVLFDKLHVNTAYVHNDLVYMVGREGVFVTDGNGLTKLSTPLDLAFLAYDWVYGNWPEGPNGTNLELHNPYSQPQIYAYGNLLYVRLWTAEFEGDLIYQDTERQYGNWQVQPKTYVLNLVSSAWSEIDTEPGVSFPRVRSISFIEPQAGFQEKDGVHPVMGIYLNFSAVSAEDLGVYWFPWHLMDPNFVPTNYIATYLDYLDNGTPYECRFVTKNYDFEMPWAFKRGHWCGISYRNISTGQMVLNNALRILRPVGYSRFPIRERFLDKNFELKYSPGTDTELNQVPKIQSFNVIYTAKSKTKW